MISMTRDFLVFLHFLKPIPFHEDIELIEAAVRLTREWIEFSEEWGLTYTEILAPFNIEDRGDIEKKELPGLILVHLLLSLEIEINEISWLRFIGQLE